MDEKQVCWRDRLRCILGITGEISEGVSRIIGPHPEAVDGRLCSTHDSHDESRVGEIDSLLSELEVAVEHIRRDVARIEDKM